MANSPDILLKCLKDDLSAQNLPSSGGFWPGMSIREAAAASISESLLKKFEYRNSSAADEAAIVKFLKVNTACKNWTLPLKSDNLQTCLKAVSDGFPVLDSKSEMLLNGFKAIIDSFWHRRGLPLVDHPYDLLTLGKIGPGANRLAAGGDFYSKFFSSRLSCSDHSLYVWYKRYISNFPEWANAEHIRQANYGEHYIVSGNRLSLVPKNDKISRCICTEPTLNTFFQLGLGAHLELRLKERFGIDLSDQQFKNRDLARLGSITDGLSTIDLSSASDSMSLNMLRWALPADMYRMLVKYRCPYSTVPGRGEVELHMISTMGNGYTFPLQTMLFCSAVTACLNFRGIPASQDLSSNLWGVNGDDIICPRSITADVIQLLNLLGFEVNSDKTFVEGPFRESCGSDFFCGSNIRGVYVKRLTELQDLYSVYNRLMRFSTRNAIDLSRTCRYVLSLIGKRRLFVPPWSNLDSGIHAPLSVARPFIRRDNLIQGYSYFTFEVKNSKIRVVDSRIVVPRRDKRRIYNPSGLLISILQSSITSQVVSRKKDITTSGEELEIIRHQGVIGTRKGDGVWRRRRRSTSSWDVAVCQERDYYDYALDWRRWESDLESAFSVLEQ